MQPQDTAGSGDNIDWESVPVLGSSLHPLDAQNMPEEVTPPEVTLLICHNFQVFLLLLSASVDLLQDPLPKSFRRAH